jgi:hypothetical protein
MPCHRPDLPQPDHFLCTLDHYSGDDSKWQAHRAILLDNLSENRALSSKHR